MTAPEPRQRRIVVLISGNGTNLQALINATLGGQINGTIVAVISNRSQAFGLRRAKLAGIATDVMPYEPFKGLCSGRDAYDESLAGAIEGYRPDLIILAGFMRILTAPFLTRFDGKVINLHPALPGCFPGLHAIERAWEAHLKNDLEETGVMVHYVIPDVDAGPVLGTRTLAMSQFNSLAELESAVHALEHELLVDMVRVLCR